MIDSSLLLAAIPVAIAVGGIVYSAGVQGQRLTGLRRDLDRIDTPEVKVTLAEVLVELRHIRETIGELKARS